MAMKVSLFADCAQMTLVRRFASRPPADTSRSHAPVRWFYLVSIVTLLCITLLLFLYEGILADDCRIS